MCVTYIHTFKEREMTVYKYVTQCKTYTVYMYIYIYLYIYNRIENLPSFHNHNIAAPRKLNKNKKKKKPQQQQNKRKQTKIYYQQQKQQCCLIH